MRSRLSENSAVEQPSRAAVIAASQPAWPPPTTITSNASVGGVLNGITAFSVGVGC
jgi:hypothetical protein